MLKGHKLYVIFCPCLEVNGVVSHIKELEPVVDVQSGKALFLPPWGPVYNYVWAPFPLQNYLYFSLHYYLMTLPIPYIQPKGFPIYFPWPIYVFRLIWFPLIKGTWELFNSVCAGKCWLHCTPIVNLAQSHICWGHYKLSILRISFHVKRSWPRFLLKVNINLDITSISPFIHYL